MVDTKKIIIAAGVVSAVAGIIYWWNKRYEPLIENPLPEKKEEIDIEAEVEIARAAAAAAAEAAAKAIAAAELGQTAEAAEYAAQAAEAAETAAQAYDRTKAAAIGLAATRAAQSAEAARMAAKTAVQATAVPTVTSDEVTVGVVPSEKDPAAFQEYVAKLMPVVGHGYSLDAYENMGYSTEVAQLMVEEDVANAVYAATVFAEQDLAGAKKGRPKPRTAYNSTKVTQAAADKKKAKLDRNKKELEEGWAGRTMPQKEVDRLNRINNAIKDCQSIKANPATRGTATGQAQFNRMATY